MTTATDEAKRRAEISSDIFGDRLRGFVGRWAPHDRRDAFDFQMDLTRIMVDAMHHKSDCMSLGIATYADLRFAEMAMHPLRFINEELKR